MPLTICYRSSFDFFLNSHGATGFLSVHSPCPLPRHRLSMPRLNSHALLGAAIAERIHDRAVGSNQ